MEESKNIEDIFYIFQIIINELHCLGKILAIMMRTLYTP